MKHEENSVSDIDQQLQIAITQWLGGRQCEIQIMTLRLWSRKRSLFSEGESRGLYTEIFCDLSDRECL